MPASAIRFGGRPSVAADRPALRIVPPGDRRSEQPAAHEPLQPLAPPMSLTAARILVVDDEPANLRLLHRMLDRAGYGRVWTTADPHEALRLVDEIRPDLLLLDLHMPQMDGVELIGRVMESQAAGTYLPILVLSGDITPEARQRALASGAKDFLSKPLDFTEALLRIRNVLETRALALELQRQNESLEEKVRARTRELEQEVAKQRRLERRLVKSEALLRSMTLNGSDLITLVTAQGLVRAVGGSVQRMLGYTPAELAGRGALDLVHPADREALTGALRAAVEDPSSSQAVEFRVLHRDGTWRCYEALGNRLPADPRLVVMSSRDVTERKRAEADLRASEARHRHLVENASDIIFQTDVVGNFTYVNPVGISVTGYSPQALLGHPYTRLVRPDMVEEVTSFYRRQIAERVPATYLEFPVRTADGRELWVGQNAQLVTSASGQVEGMQAVTRNITDRVETARLKDEFISVMSHELRTPLTSIRASLGLLANGLLDSNPERGRGMLSLAMRNTDRLMRLINDVLDLERMASGKVAVERQVYSAGELVTQAADVMRSMAEQAGIWLVVTPSPVRVFADPDRICQVLSNLVSNAVKFSSEEGTVWLSVSERESEAVFEVRDQGRGIPPEKLGLIFERFQQVDSTDARDKGGTGLGLAICRQIVEQHGGRIWAENNERRGSTFRFTLPLAPAAR
ncbi:MAG TPA: PAS domain S-box protein [Longimicrobiaceae bacterium]|nr:PAS domain S-box protein [Longimicrobiaceae bacterium]